MHLKKGLVQFPLCTVRKGSLCSKIAEVRSKKLNHSQRAIALSSLNRHSTAGQREAPSESRTHIPGTSGLSYAGHTFLALYEILKARRQLPCPTLTTCRLTCVGSSHSVTPDAPRGKVTLCQPRLLQTRAQSTSKRCPQVPPVNKHRPKLGYTSPEPDWILAPL